MKLPSGDHYIRDFLRDFDQRAQQGAALLAFLSVAAVAPSQLRASDVQSLHNRHPLTWSVGADVVRGIVDPAAAHDPARGHCLGVVKPTGQPADALVYDRRLAILSWVDDAGWPTYAPPDYREVPIAILGSPEEHGPKETMYYAFAERQRSSVMRRTTEHAQRLLTPEAIANARTQVSPFDRCRGQDVTIVRQEREATQMASRAIVARAAHEARITVESAPHRTKAETNNRVVTPNTTASDVVTDAASRAADRVDQGVSDAAIRGARQAMSDATYETEGHVQRDVFRTVSKAQHRVLGTIFNHGPNPDAEPTEDIEPEEAQDSPTVKP
ncbi:MAG: hypothetical protein ACR2M1_15110 [Gemmatimonadaceae bacterium]